MVFLHKAAWPGSSETCTALISSGDHILIAVLALQERKNLFCCDAFLHQYLLVLC